MEMKILDKISQWRERNITIHKVYNNGFQLLSEHPITNFQLELVQMEQLMLTAKNLHAQEQTAQWMKKKNAFKMTFWSRLIMLFSK